METDEQGLNALYENAQKMNEEGRAEEAIKELEKIIELTPKNQIAAKAAKDIGDMYSERFVNEDSRDDIKDNEKAVQYYLNAIKIDPNYLEAYHALGDTYSDQNNIDGALEQYNKVLNSNPNDELKAGCLSGIGDIYRNQNKLDDAFREYSKIVELNVNDNRKSNALLDIWILYKDKENYYQAIEYIKNFFKSTPNKNLASDVFSAIGSMCLDNKKYIEAENSYKEAIKYNPRNYSLHEDLANLYEKINEKENAKIEWTNCLIYAKENGEKEVRAKNHLKKLGVSEKDIDSKIKSLESTTATESIQEIVDKYKQYEKSHEKEMQERQEYHRKYKKFLSIEALKTIPIEDFEKNFLHQFLQYNGRITLTGAWRNDLEKKSQLVKESLIELFSQLESGLSLDKAVDNFLSKMPIKCDLFVTGALSDYDIERYIPFNSTVIKRMERLNLYPSNEIDKIDSFGQKYKICNEVLNDFGKKYDLTLDSLDHFLWWIEYSKINVSKDIKIPSEPQQNAADLSKKTFLSLDFLENIKDLLDDKRQLIFYGVPGTGKTYVAKEFAKYFTNSASQSDFKDRVQLIQFHQSYSYEEFMEGIRPEPLEDNKGMSYSIKAGIFKTFCEEAEKNRDKKYLLIIDEINRGNISKIFGELLFLLEYRDEKITLPYSKPLFSIPDNVYIIGTMNTADRSIAFVDYALRRRFYFVEFLPNKEVLEKWLNENPQKMSDINVLNLFTKLNEKIKNDLDEHHQIGHSYFMIKKGLLDGKRLKLIWDYNIMPLLKEYFFTKRNLDDYSFESMIKS